MTLYLNNPLTCAALIAALAIAYVAGGLTWPALLRKFNGDNI